MLKLYYQHLLDMYISSTLLLPMPCGCYTLSPLESNLTLLAINLPSLGVVCDPTECESG